MLVFTYLQYAGFIVWMVHVEYMIRTVDKSCYTEYGYEITECSAYYENPDQVIRGLWIWWSA